MGNSLWADEADCVAEFPFESDYDTQSDSSDRAHVYLQPEYESVIVPPIGSEAHVEEMVHNYQYGDSFGTLFQELIQDDRVRDGITLGWNLSNTDYFRFTIDEDGEFTPQGDTDYRLIRGSTTLSLPEGNKELYYFRLPYMASLAAGYSALLIEPGVFRSQTFGNEKLETNLTVLPQLIHINDAPHYLDVPVVVEPGKSYKLNHGKPLAQLIPFNRNLLQPQMEVNETKPRE